jgi:hypothetical protein
LLASISISLNTETVSKNGKNDFSRMREYPSSDWGKEIWTFLVSDMIIILE